MEMNRRDLIKAAGVLAMTAGTTNYSFAQKSNVVVKKSIDVRFTHGVHFAALPDGSWNLWVRCAPRDQNIRLVRLELHVAEDEAFGLIISRQIYVARKEASFIARTNFSTKSYSPELYFRFVALDSGLPESPNALIVSEVGKIIVS